MMPSTKVVNICLLLAKISKRHRKSFIIAVSTFTEKVDVNFFDSLVSIPVSIMKF
jgi:hypothetical protein